jgi:hypothetical protein
MRALLASSRASLVVVLLALVGCDAELATPTDGDVDGKADTVGGFAPFPAAPDPVPRRFAPGALLTDELLRGGEQITVAQVQDFLALEGSGLASYAAPDGRTAAELIVDLALDHGVSPLYMLARIQTESSLIGSGTLRGLARATGCGCPDGGRCDRTLSGFAAQVDCAAVLIEDYYDELDTTGATRSGWKVGVARRTLEGCRVVAQDRATASLYTYTPWVGRYTTGCGTRSAGGSTMLALIFHDYWASYHWGADP